MVKSDMIAMMIAMERMLWLAAMSESGLKHLFVLMQDGGGGT